MSGPDLFEQEQTLILEALDNQIRALVAELEECKEVMAIYSREGVSGFDIMKRIRYIKGEIARNAQLMHKLTQVGWKA